MYRPALRIVLIYCLGRYVHLYERGPSAAAERFIDLLEGLKGSESVGNNEILFAINDHFDVNVTEVREKLLEVARKTENGIGVLADEYCTVKLIRKTK